MQEPQIITTDELKVAPKEPLPELAEILQEVRRIELRNEANHSWVSSLEMKMRLAQRGVKNA